MISLHPWYKGRSGRLEFFTCELGIWLLAPFLLGVTFGVLGAFIPGASGHVPPEIMALYYMAAYTFHIMLIVRRFHDLGRSGWSFFWLCVPLVNIWAIITLLGGPSIPENKWGAPPPTKVLWFSKKHPEAL